ncbi:hypothetical protein AALP_AA1G296100 [Arabis alpina]|uniref:Magnesium transporter n=1 Tax=Arabis alpina TaxID=50452 RepID=A0A087HRI3_ARAAL|nr:hypothetical protein AALP_AA1G296100 [Arabis alpina]
MRELGLLLKPSPFNSMLSLTSQHTMVKEILREMEQNKVEPDILTVNKVLKVFAAESKVEAMETFMSTWSGENGIKLERGTLVAMAKAYDKSGSIVKAIEMFGNLGGSKRRVSIFGTSTREKVEDDGYRSVISSLLKLDDVQGAENIYGEWKPDGPNLDLSFTGFTDFSVLRRRESISLVIEMRKGPLSCHRKTGGARLWMRFGRTGAMEVKECDKTTIIEHTSIPARDLRILGPVFSHSSNILAREKAIVVNLEVLKAIITAEEVLLLDPIRPEVLPFVDRLKQQFPQRNGSENVQTALDPDQGLESELPFEFKVLEIALEVVCSIVDTSVAALETEAWPVLNELTKNLNTENLEYVRSVKSNLTRLLAGVQKVRDELEHLLDDNKDMADLYLTRKWIKNQQTEVILASNRRANMLTSNADEDDVEVLEMLLEAYFMQLEGMLNKIITVREYIDDTEDYVKIQLRNQRNEMYQMKLILIIASFAIGAATLLASLFGMNIHCQLYDDDMKNIFGYVVWSIIVLCVGLFLVTLGYARWKKLLGS